MWDECNCVVVEHSLALPFFGIGMKTDLFQSCGHCWVFQICWHIECNTFTASSFRIWNSSTGIPLTSLALFKWCFLWSTWRYIPGCLAPGEWSHHRDYLGCEDLFLYSSSVYSSHILLISSASRPSITHTPKRCPFHYRGLKCKSRKSRDSWSNSQIWPWSTEWSRAKANRVLPREPTGHSKHPLPTTQEKTLHMDITRWSNSKSYWLYSLLPKMEKLYTVRKNKTRSRLWLRSWTPYCQIQT